jgi:hypothetical protein
MAPAYMTLRSFMAPGRGKLVAYVCNADIQPDDSTYCFAKSVQKFQQTWRDGKWKQHWIVDDSSL